MPNKTKENGINYSEEQLAQKRAVVLDFLDKQKKGLVEKKKPVEAKPAVILPTKPRTVKTVMLPKTEIKQIVEPEPPNERVAPISQFLGSKNEAGATEPLEVDFLEDVKREKLQKKNSLAPKVTKKVEKTAEKKVTTAAVSEPAPISVIAEPPIAPGSKTTPSVNLIAGMGRRDSRRTGGFQWFGFAAVVTMILFSFYFLICLAFFTFKPHSSFFRRVASVVPIPGLISSYGFVEFYQYIDLKEGLLAKGADPAQIADLATSASVEWQILEQLARYYQIRPAGSAVDLLDKLGKSVVSDKEINAAAFSSVRKIRQEIVNGKGLEEAASSYGAESFRAYFSIDDARYKFGPGFASLTEGAVSNIIVSSDGFYIVQKIGADEGAIDVKYVLVKPKTLSDIVNGKLSQAKAINFVR